MEVVCRRSGPDQPGELGGSAAWCQGKRPSHAGGRPDEHEDVQSCDIFVPTAFQLFRPLTGMGKALFKVTRHPVEWNSAK